MSKQTMARRDFLWRSLAGVSVAGSWPLFLGKTAAAVQRTSDREDDRALVVLQLSGGNDGLSTVVPYSDPAYASARETTRIGERDVLQIDERVGMHPNLKELKKLYDDGRMAIVQGTSYPNPSRSHFQAMDIWHAGDLSGARRGSGWLGRALDAVAPRHEPTAAVNIGGSVPLALVGQRTKPVAFENPERYRWRGRSPQQEAFQSLNSAASKAGPTSRIQQLDFLLRVAGDADRSSAAIREAVQGYRPAVEYPQGNQLTSGLQSVAAMLAGGLPTKIYYVSLGGFDTHANQRAVHDNLMTAFSGAISAFLNDLGAQKLLDRVVLLCFTEFGRRVKENGSRGTDHGVAGPMFLFGSQIRGGLHGQHPSLTELVEGDLAMNVDFRQVYATVLDGWLGTSSKEVLGESFQHLPLLKTSA